MSRYKASRVQPGSVRWHLERLKPGESFTVSRRVDGDTGKKAMKAARDYVQSRITSSAFRPTVIDGLTFERGEYRTQSFDYIVCVTATKDGA